MKKILSVILAVILVAGITVPVQTLESHAAFNIRTTVPAYASVEGQTYYYSDSNIFYRHDLGPNQKYLSGYKGYCVGNCTWYAYGRASEILGQPFNSNFRWSASQWWDINIAGNYYPYGSEPKAGAIACYSTHVAIVEKVENGTVYVSESGWQVSKDKPVSETALRFHYGTPWQSSPKGYIYITDSMETTAKAVDYRIQITADDLNLRTGPGTEYSRVGYAKTGTYQVSQECGNWGKLADNGYWVCLSYVTKVTSTGETSMGIATVQPSAQQPAAEATVSKSSSSQYKVKVTASSLNMRSGPGTKYSNKGSVKKGKKYTIKKTKNGWGQLKKNGYWIKLSYTKIVGNGYKVKVTAKDLNMRKGPGTKYAKKGCVKPGVYAISKINGKWGKLKKNGYWIKLSYVKKV